MRMMRTMPGENVLRDDERRSDHTLYHTEDCEPSGYGLSPNESLWCNYGIKLRIFSIFLE
jgi:hypothetical protein